MNKCKKISKSDGTHEDYFSECLEQMKNERNKADRAMMVAWQGCMIAVKQLRKSKKVLKSVCPSSIEDMKEIDKCIKENEQIVQKIYKRNPMVKVYVQRNMQEFEPIDASGPNMLLSK